MNGDWPGGGGGGGGGPRRGRGGLFASLFDPFLSSGVPDDLGARAAARRRPRAARTADFVCRRRLPVGLPAADADAGRPAGP